MLGLYAGNKAAVTRQSRGSFFGLGLTNVLQIYEIVYSPSDWDEKTYQ
jgi:hypothetical protein